MNFRKNELCVKEEHAFSCKYIYIYSYGLSSTSSYDMSHLKNQETNNMILLTTTKIWHTAENVQVLDQITIGV